MTTDDNQRSELFALYQARLRADEIEFEAREIHDSALKKLVDSSYEKMNSDYVIERSKIERNAKINFSMMKNQQRIEILNSQRNIVENAMDLTREKLKKLKNSSEYRGVYANLIKQGLKVLHEPKAEIFVIEEDLELAKECLNGVISEVSKEFNVKATISTEKFLEKRLIGGALITNEEGTISVDNTFETRLRLSSNGALPKISEVLGK